MSEEDKKLIIEMIIGRFDAFEKKVDKRFDDHGKKLDDLISWKFKLAGGGVVVIAIFSYLSNLLIK